MDCAWWRFTVDLGRQPVDGVIVRLMASNPTVAGSAAAQSLQACTWRASPPADYPAGATTGQTAMTEFLYRLGRRCADNGWRVIGIWFLIAMVVMGANRLFGGGPRTLRPQGHRFLSRPEPAQPRLPGHLCRAVPIVLYDPTTDFTDPNGERIVDDVVAEIARHPQVSAVVSPADRPDLVSDDGHTAIVSLTVNERFAADTAIGERRSSPRRRRPQDPTCRSPSAASSARRSPSPRPTWSEALGLLSAVFILFLTLRRWGATSVPLASALFSVGLGLALVGLLSRLVFIPDVAPTLGTMLGLVCGIDYALFLPPATGPCCTRATTSRRGRRTAGTAGAGMVFAGGT